MSTTHPILIAGAWADDPSAETFSATNPANGESLEDSYPVSSRETLERMARSLAEAASHLNALEPHRVSAFLDAHAALIDERRVSIAEMAHRETGLAKSPRLLESEMDRTIDQLRQAAASVRSGEWVSARIDTQKNLRSMYEPLGGGVLTIGPNNFPLAYNAIAGGDFAAAIAARNPVIAKGHPLHPGTTRLLAECAHDAATGTKMPAGTVQLFYHCSPEDGLELIRMPEVSAFGFTGSQKAGLAMKEAAD
ncbi:MAG: aldehyde dehydrogenase family protein, partial [bacterium]|nr:aldehyde dehydrogenase family protein [bacterium]